jgi:pimeloyl-ACP methyl ester carboxylesterase
VSDVPSEPARTDDEYAAQPRARVRGRLAPEAMFPAGEQGYRTRFERLASGERVRIVEAGPVSGVPLVFLGGWGCCIWDFNRMYPAVARAGYRAIAVDLRGHGLSDMPDGVEAYTTDAMVAHLGEVLDVLGVVRPVIVGHSMGGALGAHLAIRNPGRLRALVPVSSIGFGVARPPELGRVLSPQWLTPLLRVSLRRAVVALGLRVLYGDNTCVDARNVDEYWAPSQFVEFVPAMRALLQGFRWTRFTSEELEAIRVPCLLVRGGRDPIVSRPRAPIHLPGGSREIVFERAGHLPHDELSERVNAVLLEFLGTLT